MSCNCPARIQSCRQTPAAGCTCYTAEDVARVGAAPQWPVGGATPSGSAGWEEPASVLWPPASRTFSWPVDRSQL